MKIKKWEEYVIKKYEAIKVDNFLELKKYLSNEKNYAHNFTPEEITETEIMNDEYYSAYVFDESKIVKRDVKSKHNTCWNKLIVVLASKDFVNISNYCINTAGGLTDKEYTIFYNDINPLGEEKTLE